MSELDKIEKEWRRKWAKMTYRQREDCLNRANAEFEQREFAAERERIFYNLPKERRL